MALFCGNPQPHEPQDCVPQQIPFAIGEKVHYPNHGVAVVENVGESLIMPPGSSYYHLRLLANNSRLVVPTDSVGRFGMRRLYEKRDIKAVCAYLEKKAEPLSGDWEGRYRENLARMATGRLEEVAHVLKALTQVQQYKSLSFREKKMYDRAKYLLVSEISIVTEISEAEAEKLVGKLLGKAFATRAAS